MAMTWEDRPLTGAAGAIRATDNRGCNNATTEDEAVWVMSSAPRDRL